MSPTVRRSAVTLSVCNRTSHRIVLFANRICTSRFWLHEHCGCTIVHVQTIIHTLHTAQCTCFRDNDMDSAHAERLRQRRERDRDKCASETPERGEERLRV